MNQDPIDDELLKRIAHDSKMVACGYDFGLVEGEARAYRACCLHLKTQADLCDRGITPSADLLRILAATFDAMAVDLSAASCSEE